VREQTWEAAFTELAAGYEQALTRARRVGEPRPRQRIAA